MARGLRQHVDKLLHTYTYIHRQHTIHPHSCMRFERGIDRGSPPKKRFYLRNKLSRRNGVPVIQSSRSKQRTQNSEERKVYTSGVYLHQNSQSVAQTNKCHVHVLYKRYTATKFRSKHCASTARAERREAHIWVQLYHGILATTLDSDPDTSNRAKNWTDID